MCRITETMTSPFPVLLLLTVATCHNAGRETPQAETDSTGQVDWLQNGAFYAPTITKHEEDLYVVVGMSPNADCSEVAPRNELKLYVGPSTLDTCQGWYHNKAPYPSTAQQFNDSAIRVQCHDGYISYSQSGPFGPFNCSVDGVQHKDFNGQCKQGWPSDVHTEILDFSGCLKQGFSPNVTDPSVYCGNKCDDYKVCGSPAGQTCSALVQQYSCEKYYCPTCDYAGWCDKECGFGVCSKDAEGHTSREEEPQEEVAPLPTSHELHDLAAKLTEGTSSGEPQQGANSTAPADWLQSGALYAPSLSKDDEEYFVIVGMGQASDCSDITPRLQLKLYVGPSTLDTCQGWYHNKAPYPSTAQQFNDSAIRVQCHDGYISYSQSGPFGPFNCSVDGVQHKDFNGQCKQGWPSDVHTEILDFSGCLKQGFSPNVTDPSVYCGNKCDDYKVCGSPAGQTCSALVQQYSCEKYYCPTCDYAGWCDKECGFGVCSKDTDGVWPL